VEEKDIDVTVTNDSVTIKGEKKEEKEDKDKNYYYMERSYGSFSRVIPLEAEIESNKAEASFKNGILDIKIPKNQKAKAKETKVPIKTV
jgi:HSP20 family protein